LRIRREGASTHLENPQTGHAKPFPVAEKIPTSWQRESVASFRSRSPDRVCQRASAITCRRHRCEPVAPRDPARSCCERRVKGRNPAELGFRRMPIIVLIASTEPGQAAVTEPDQLHLPSPPGQFNSVPQCAIVCTSAEASLCAKNRSGQSCATSAMFALR